MAKADRSSQRRRFHEPIGPNDSGCATEGCRHTNPDICKSNGLVSVCAFVRGDRMCLMPPKSWSRQYVLLVAKASDNNGNIIRDEAHNESKSSL